MKEDKHIFGPVPSRRLGVSLGVDIIPYKTCSLDCLYCQLGQTTRKTTQRKEYVKKSVILKELEKVEFCCDAHKYIYAFRLTADWMEEQIGERPCLICDSEEDSVATGFDIPLGQTQHAGTPPLKVFWYKLCGTCIQLENLPLVVSQALAFEMAPEAGKSKMIH